MQKIAGAGATAQNTFTKGDPATGVPATEVTQEWLNTIQAELVYIVEQAGLTLDALDDTQLKVAIDMMIALGSKALGDGQTWQNMTASRVKDVTYTNTTGRSIAILIRLQSDVNISQHIHINGVSVVYSTLMSVAGQGWGLQLPMVIIPNGATYSYLAISGTLAWWELR